LQIVSYLMHDFATARQIRPKPSAWYITIDVLMRHADEITLQYNVHPRNTGNSEKFLQLIFNHSDDDEYNASVSIKSRFTKIVNLLHLVDSNLSINSVYDNPLMLPIIKSHQLPVGWLPLQAYIFINITQTLQPPNTDKDGNVRRQAPTYTTVRVSTSVDINYAISILAVNLLEQNCKIFVKALDFLTSKPCFAIMGTRVDWNFLSLTTELRAEIADFIQQGHSDGKWEKMIEFNNQTTPLFSLKLQKMKAPKASEKISDKEQEFMDYYHNLRSVIAFEVPDGDYEWVCTVLEDFRKAGLLKVLVSRMATIKILPGNKTLLGDINKYTRSLKYQMILNSQTSLTRMDSVLSMHSAVIVEVVEGRNRPYKKTHLKRELLSLRLAPTKEGEGNSYIEGSQYVTNSGSPQGGGGWCY
jgi:hypothetical protein